MSRHPAYQVVVRSDRIYAVGFVEPDKSGDYERLLNYGITVHWTVAVPQELSYSDTGRRRAARVLK